jgi:kynureninase
MSGAGYFLYHSIGMFPDKARLVSESLARLGAVWGTPDDSQWDASLAIRSQFIERWRQLIGAPSGTMTTAENVTTALHSVVGSLPEQHLRGRKLLIAADCFPGVHFLLSGMAARHGYTLDTVRPRPGENWVRSEDFIARWDTDVGVALITFVTSHSSYRCDLSALLAQGRRMGSLVGVDITQGIGIVPFDLRSYPVDFIASTTLKWLCGVAGAGVLYVREALLRDCQPELRGWFSQEDIFAWSLDAFRYAPDARRFDHGTPSVMACAGSLPALEWHAAQEPSALSAHNLQLTEAIVQALPPLGLPLVSPADAGQRGGSVMFRLPEAVKPQAVIDQLRSDEVYADCRGMTLRLSPGNVTTIEGVEQLARSLARILKP